MLKAAPSTVKDQLSPLVWGGIAGLAGTVPMTFFMLGAHRFLPKWQKYALPPQRITGKLAERIGMRKQMSQPELRLAALISHFGYGTSMGAAYGMTVGRVSRRPLTGLAYGLGIWAAGYLGWLPLAGILPPTTERPRQRVALMVAAHMVWGTTLGLVMHLLASRSKPTPTNT